MREEQPDKYGERGEKRTVHLQEGTKPNTGAGTSATNKTEDRQPPKGGSGTSPPKDQRK